MKTAKETAKELINKLYPRCTSYSSDRKNQQENAKECALILVDENVKMLKIILNESTEIYQSLNTPKKLCIDLLNPLLKFWDEVKEEIVNYENQT